MALVLTAVDNSLDPNRTLSRVAWLALTQFPVLGSWGFKLKKTQKKTCRCFTFFQRCDEYKTPYLECCLLLFNGQ